MAFLLQSNYNTKGCVAVNRKKQSMILIVVLLIITAVIYFFSPSGARPKSKTTSESAHSIELHSVRLQG
ncbi:hypothetical protein D0B88_05260 [Cellvibrio sp. KY-YJ-3]|nr:hypothetical protein D0B88_05260 [Cellvibrio sp. KY-YJ-3]